MIAVWLAPVLASPSLRAQAEEADARRDWAAALERFERCATEAPDRDARYCRTRADALAPHAAEGFAGWSVLEEVRREYRTLGPDVALARVETALGDMPESPAAPAMKLWLINERNRLGQRDEVARLGQELAADTRSDPVAVRYAAGITEKHRDDARHRVIGLVGVAVAAVYAAVGLARGGPLQWRSAALAGVSLGAVPAGMAAIYEDGVADGFVRAAIVVSVSVLLARRAPIWVAVPGALGGLAAVAWDNGWYPSLGF